jgi:hypothetical protein
VSEIIVTVGNQTGTLFKVSGSIMGSGTFSPILPANVINGNTLSVSAIPSVGYTFSSWLGDVPENDKTNSYLNLLINKDTNLIAVFTKAEDDDNDGLPNDWETIYGNLEREGDDDHDGVINIIEFQNGTNPLMADAEIEFELIEQKVEEGHGNLIVKIIINGALLNSASFNLDISNSSASLTSDFTISESGLVTISAGQSVKNIVLNILSDEIYETTETIKLNISGFKGISPGKKLDHVVKIRNNLTGNDTDSDGLPDSWEILNFGNLTKNALDDSDGDGLNAMFEYRYGLDPNNSGDQVPNENLHLKLKNVLK